MINHKVKTTKNLFKLWDPNFQYLCYASELVILYLMLSLYWMYTAKPMTSLICFGPTAVICGIIAIGSFKQRSRFALDITVVMAIAAFLACVFARYPLALVISMTLIVFFTFSSAKYRYMAYVASSIAGFGILPSGWASGLERICETLVGTVCVFLTLLVSELIFGKIIIRNTLKYVSELVHDFFILATDYESEIDVVNGIFCRHLYKEDSLARTDLYLHEVFTTDISKFRYKALMIFQRFEGVFADDRFFFKTNFKMSGKLLEIFTLFRRIFRDMSLLDDYKKNKDEFDKLIPEIESVTAYIRSTLFASVYAVRKESSSYLSDEKLSLNWSDCLKKIKECDMRQYSEFLNIYYSFDFMLKNIDLLKSEIRELYR